METIRVFTQGLPNADRARAEAVLGKLMRRALRERAKINFAHADSLNGEVGISVPKLNGELLLSESKLLAQIGDAMVAIVGSGPVSCQMRGTNNAWRRLW